MAMLNHILQIAMMLYLHRSHSAEMQSTNISINGSCNFAEPKFPSRNEMTVHTMTPAARKWNLLYCNVWYISSSHHVVRLWLQKTSDRNHTYLVTTVLDQYGALVLPGYVAQADEHVSYPFLICPGKDESMVHNYSIFLSALPETGLNLTVQVDESMLEEGHTKSFELGYQMTSRILVFNVSKIQSIYHDHFQVTVRSDDSDEECLLIVSDACPNVVDQATDKDLRSAVRLSFTTLGRITLSHASNPQLKTGRWFIGVFMKHPKRGRGRDAMKTVRVSVGFAGGTQRSQVGFLAAVSLLGGLAVAVFAHVFLNPDFKNGCVVWLQMYMHERRLRGTDRADDQADATSALEMGEQLRENQTIESVSDGSVLPTRIDSAETGDGIDSAETGDGVTVAPSYDVSRCNVPRQWPGFKNWGKVMYHWFYDEEKTFAYTTAIVAFSLLTGAAQFIISNWREMIDSGDRDICYYNDFCYRAATRVDMPFNLIISNMGYVIHGIVLALSVSLREATSRINYVDATKSYSIAYAFSWALVFEGIFSSFYHLCPSRMTFQFDSAFMFVMCALVVAAVFNSQAEKAQRIARRSEAAPCGCSAIPSPIRDSKLFLFFFIPLLLLNYLGSIRDTDGFLLFPNWVFYCLAIVWITCMFGWAFYRLMIPWRPAREAGFWCKFVWLCVLFPVSLLFIGLYTVDLKRNWSQFFLFSCLAAVLCTAVGFCLAKCSRNIYESAKRRRDLTAEERRGLQWRMHFKWPIANFPVVVYMVGLAACWVSALHFFLRKSVTEKVSLPSRSRELNQECVLWEYFDYHDLWHILSSFALLQSAYLFLWSIG